MKEAGIWLSITEYSQYRNISVSTIRRYIKAKSVKSKKVDGKYLIYVNSDKYEEKFTSNSVNKEITNLKIIIENLKAELRVVKEEKADLQMLVSLYEKSQKNNEVNHRQ